MSNYPPYVCKCCGYANGDMFYDHFYYQDREPTEEEWLEFKGYKKAWNILSDERRKAREAQHHHSVFPRTTIGKRHTEETRAKISASQKARFR